MLVPVISSIVPSCRTLQGARDRYFLVLLVVLSVDRVCPRKLDGKGHFRAALVPLAPWSGAMSQIVTAHACRE